MDIIDKNVNKTSAAEPRRRRQPEAARENILAAAEAMLIEAGPQSLKLADTARAAGVSNASVLHYFGSTDGVQTALMERMVRQLVDQVLAISPRGAASIETAAEGIIALFDAFEARGAARLAAWLELTGESRRLTVVRAAVQEVVAARAGWFAAVPGEAMEDFMLASISLALGVGLFGPTLTDLLGKPAGRAREVALRLLLGQLQNAITAI